MSKVYTVRARDIEVELEEAGEGERAFVLVHGFTGSRDDFREQLPELAKLGRTIALDNRGHGGTTNSGKPEVYTTANLAEDLAAALDALGLARVDLLGHSLGGMIALRFTLAHPERVASLVLMDTAARSLGRLMPEKLRDALAAFVRANGVGAMVARMREAQARSERPRAAVRCEERMGSDSFWARIQSKHDAMDPIAWDALSVALAQHESLLPRLGEIRAPTLVLVGEEDALFVPAAQELAAGLPGAKLVTIPNAAHSPQLENPEAWRAAIVAHLRAVRGGG